MRGQPQIDLLKQKQWNSANWHLSRQHEPPVYLHEPPTTHGGAYAQQ